MYLFPYPFKYPPRYSEFHRENNCFSKTDPDISTPDYPTNWGMGGNPPRVYEMRPVPMWEIGSDDDEEYEPVEQPQQLKTISDVDHEEMKDAPGAAAAPYTMNPVIESTEIEDMPILAALRPSRKKSQREIEHQEKQEQEDTAEGLSIGPPAKQIQAEKQQDQKIATANRRMGDEAPGESAVDSGVKITKSSEAWGDGSI